MSDFLISSIKLFQYYKSLADKSIQRLNDNQLLFTPNKESNSAAVIIKHIAGNMLSRWTDFLTSDGEKTWRNRDEEFVIEQFNKEALIAYWEKGWSCLFDTLNSLNIEDLNKTVYIRNEGYTVTEAIQRQTAHYAYHIGQIVFIAKMQSEQWESLSIPRHQSASYNNDKFSQNKDIRHFTDNV